MLYIIHRDRVDCGVLDLEPRRPDQWLTDSIVRFTSVLAPFSTEIEYAILTSMSGVAWHLEILAVVHSGTDSHVSARVLRSLKADEEILSMIQDFASRSIREGRAPAFGEKPLRLPLTPIRPVTASAA